MGLNHAFGKLGQSHQADKSLAGQAPAGGMRILGMVEIDSRFGVAHQYLFLQPLAEKICRLLVARITHIARAMTFHDIQTNHVVGISQAIGLDTGGIDHIIGRGYNLIEAADFLRIKVDSPERGDKGHALSLLFCYSSSDNSITFQVDIPEDGRLCYIL